MKNILLSVLLLGLALAPLSGAQTSAQPAGPVCVSGGAAILFNEDGEPVTHDYRYYRCQLKAERNGYLLVQNFYWPSGKKQSDPYLIAKAGLRKWSDALTGNIGPFVVWYENGQKQLDSNFSAGKPDGQAALWHENGQKGAVVRFTVGKGTGQGVFWYANGQKQAEGQFAAGKKTGRWVFWYENGQKESEGEYRRDNRIGPWTFWQVNGQKKREGQYVGGEKNGLWTFFYESGQKMAEIHLKSGKIVDRKMWSEDGELQNEGGKEIDLSE